MKRIALLIMCIVIVLVMVACDNSALSLDGSYYREEEKGNVTLDIEGDTVLLTDYGNSYKGTIDKTKKEIVFEDEEEPHKYELVNGKMSVFGHTYVKGEYEETEEKKAKQEKEDAEEKAKEEEEKRNPTIDSAYDLEGHSYKSDIGTLDFYEDSNYYLEAALTVKGISSTGMVDEDDDYIKWDDGSKSDIVFVNNKKIILKSETGNLTFDFVE